MADSPVKPLMVSADVAARRVLRALGGSGGEVVYPRTAAIGAWLLGKVSGVAIRYGLIR